MRCNMHQSNLTPSITTPSISINLSPTLSPNPQKQGVWSGRTINKSESSQFASYMTQSVPRVTLVAFLFFAFLVIPFSVLFTGIGLMTSLDEQLSSLGKRMTIGAGAALGGELLTLCLSLSSTVCFYGAVRGFNRWERSVND